MGAQVEILFPIAEVNDPTTRAWFVDGGCNQSRGPGATGGDFVPGALPHQIGTDTLLPDFIPTIDVVFDESVVESMDAIEVVAGGELPDRSLDAIDLAQGFGTNNPPSSPEGWANALWDHENAVPNRLDTTILDMAAIILPGHGEFSVDVHTWWHFTFGVGQPKLRISVSGMDGGELTVTSPPYTGGVVLGDDEGFGGGGYISTQEVKLSIARRPVITSPPILGIAVDLDNKRIWGRVVNLTAS
jgi:hypothetical protein